MTGSAKQSRPPRGGMLDCFAALAMTESLAVAVYCNTLPASDRRIRRQTDHGAGAISCPGALLTPPEFVIQHNYSDKDANDTGKRRDRCRGRLRAASDREGGPGSDRGSEPAGQAQRAQ